MRKVLSKDWYPPDLNPSLLPLAIPALLGVFGLMGTTFNSVLDHEYGLPAALHATVVVGFAGVVFAMFVLSLFAPPSSPGGFPPVARA